MACQRSEHHLCRLAGAASRRECDGGAGKSLVNEKWHSVLERTHKAVRAYARVEIDVLARKVIYRLQRFPASGIYGDEYKYKSLWDEYCHELQEGPHDLPGPFGNSPTEAWQMTMSPFINDVVDAVPQHSAVLLSIAAFWELDIEEDEQLIGAVCSDDIGEVLLNRINEHAGARSLHRFDPLW